MGRITWAKAALVLAGVTSSNAVHQGLDGRWWTAAWLAVMAALLLPLHRRFEKEAERR